MENNEALHEREVLIKAFSEVTKEFEGRGWIMDGRGCYSFDDMEYRKEVSYLFEAFERIKLDMWSKIKSKTFEYKNKVEKPLLEKQEQLIDRLEEALNLLDDFSYEAHLQERRANLNMNAQNLIWEIRNNAPKLLDDDIN